MLNKKPRLTPNEVNKAISYRTGLPVSMIKTVVDAYVEIAKECLLGQVEVSFGNMLSFTWKQINPRENVRTYNHQKKDFDPPHAVPGFQRTGIRVNKNWGDQLKEATKFELGEDNPATTNLVEYNEDDDTEEGEYDELQIDDADE